MVICILLHRTLNVSDKTANFLRVEPFLLLILYSVLFCLTMYIFIID